MKEQKIFTNVAEIFIIKRLFKKNYLLLKESLKLHNVLRYFLCATNLSTVTHMHNNKRAKMKLPFWSIKSGPTYQSTTVQSKYSN